MRGYLDLNQEFKNSLWKVILRGYLAGGTIVTLTVECALFYLFPVCQEKSKSV